MCLRTRPLICSMTELFERTTKREVLFSAVIIAIMLLFGFMISGAIDNAHIEKCEEYNKAQQIDNEQSKFVRGMRTNIGNAFVYGDLICLDPVTYSEIGGNYSHVEKEMQKYTEHTKIETYTDDDGKTHTRTVTYWEWDTVDSWDIYSTKISFLNVEFPYGTIKFSGDNYITTINESSRIRYNYYGSLIKETGTIYANLSDNTIKDVKFYRDQTIQDAIDSLNFNGGIIAFWIAWVILIVGCVIGFYWIDNRWLEDRRTNGFN